MTQMGSEHVSLPASGRIFDKYPMVLNAPGDDSSELAAIGNMSSLKALVVVHWFVSASHAERLVTRNH